MMTDNELENILREYHNEATGLIDTRRLASDLERELNIDALDAIYSAGGRDHDFAREVMLAATTQNHLQRTKPLPQAPAPRGWLRAVVSVIVMMVIGMMQG